MSKRKPRNVVQKLSTQIVEVVELSQETKEDLLDIIGRLGISK